MKYHNRLPFRNDGIAPLTSTFSQDCPLSFQKLVIDNDQLGPVLDLADSTSNRLSITITPGVIGQMLNGRPEYARRLTRHDLTFGCDLADITRLHKGPDSKVSKFKPYMPYCRSIMLRKRLSDITRKEVEKVFLIDAAHCQAESEYWVGFFKTVLTKLREVGVERKLIDIEQAWDSLRPFVVNAVMSHWLAKRANKERLKLISENFFVQRFLRAFIAWQGIHIQAWDKENNKRLPEGPDSMTDIRLFLYTGPNDLIVSNDRLVRRIGSILGDVRVVTARELFGLAEGAS